MGYLMTPKGKRIDRTVETIPGTCGLADVTKNADGTFELQYDGLGTDIDWDNQTQDVTDSEPRTPLHGPVMYRACTERT